MDFSIKVNDAAFAYLRLQKGSLDSVANNRKEWQSRYEADLRTTLKAIAPFLPTKRWPVHLLDVGSGLGGIDVLIRRYIDEHNEDATHVHLLDGMQDPPVMRLHRQTFNDMTIAREFQMANGLSPDRFHARPPTLVNFNPHLFDLVVSFGSWCFHYPPSVYLPRLMPSLHPDCVLILDVRQQKSDWMHDLETVFDLVDKVTLRVKWARCVFKLRAR